MLRAARLFLALLLFLAVVALVGEQLMARTTRAWFEHDLTLRSQLAVASASQSLVESWSDPSRLGAVLSDMTRDERIMGAAACSETRALMAATQGFPREFTCESVLDRMAEQGSVKSYWAMTSDLPSGPVHLSVTAAEDGRGSVILVHDLSFLARRETTTRKFLFYGVFVLALGASVVTFLAQRFAWQGWTSGLRRALSL